MEKLCLYVLTIDSINELWRSNSFNLLINRLNQFIHWQLRHRWLDFFLSRLHYTFTLSNNNDFYRLSWFGPLFVLNPWITYTLEFDLGRTAIIWIIFVSEWLLAIWMKWSFVSLDLWQQFHSRLQIIHVPYLLLNPIDTIQIARPSVFFRYLSPSISLSLWKLSATSTSERPFNSPLFICRWKISGGNFHTKKQDPKSHGVKRSVRLILQSNEAYEFAANLIIEIRCDSFFCLFFELWFF